MSVTSWFLVSSSGTRHRLPRELIFVGREDCELMLQSRSVDKQHAVINYNPATDQHLVKDLGSLNGTFVNDLRIPEQTYFTLKLSDISQHIVPEEALKHEKYTSQLQMGKHAETEDRPRPEKPERTKTQNRTQIQNTSQSQSQSQTPTPSQTPDCPGPRPTPLYGQPSWWGEEDMCSDGLHPEAQNPELCDFRENQAGFPGYHREASYFEIPTKDFHQHPKSPEAELHEVPTKDTDTPLATPPAPAQAQAPPSPPTPTPPVVQSHASFTIEFDDFTPGKIKIKDHVTKFTSRQRKQQALHLKAPVGAPVDLMSAESKVADWLVHSDVSMMKKRPTCEDVYSTKSDQAINTKTLKGHHHEDGTQSDSEEPVLVGRRSKSNHSVQTDQSEVSQQTVKSGQSVCSQQAVPMPAVVSPSSPDSLSQSPPQSHSPPNQTPIQEPPTQVSPHHGSPSQGSPSQTSTPGPPEHLSQQAFIIEFFDDNPRKKRSQSFTHTPAQADSYSALKAKMERRKGTERPASVHGHLPPTQQVTVPLKAQGHGTPQRSSSLKREKTEGDVLASATPRAPPTRPFGSVGKKSKLVQEFAAEFLKDSGGPPSPTRDRPGPPPMSAPPVMVSPACMHLPSPQESPKTPTPASYPSSPAPPVPVSSTLTPTPTRSTLAASLGPPASPARQPGPAQAAMLPPGLVRGLDPRTQRVGRNEEDDSLSDAGTYTIETECHDTEVEEARNMIDQVFGVLDSPEYSGVNSSVYRPVINEGKDEHTSLEIDGSAVDPMHGFNPATISGTTTGPVQVPPANAAGMEGPKWVSRWASLADSYAEGASPPSVGESLDDSRYLSSRSVMSQSESECSQVSRTKRLLPQVPPGERLEGSTPSILIQQDSYPGPETLDREARATCPPESGQLLSIRDDVDPDSLSDTSRSDDGQERAHRTKAKTTAKASSRAPVPQVRPSERVSPSPSTKSTCFYIGSDSPGKADPPRSLKEAPSKNPPTTVLIRHLSGHEPRRTSVKPNSSAPNLQLQDKDSVPTKDGAIVRQESFTKERQSDTVQKKKLPHISSHPSIRDMEQRKEAAPDVFFKESEGPLFHSSGSGRSSKKGGSSSHMGDSLSGDSDVDTASTVSQVSNKNTPVTSVSKKRSVISGLQKEKSSSSPSIQEKGRQLSARERLSEKRRGQVGSDASGGKAEAAKRFHMRRSAGNRGSLDLSEGQPGQSHGDNVSSDHEAGSRTSGRTKKLTAPLQKEDNGKTSKTAAQQVLTRSNSLSAPRPTRASMLRRARLGETSDNEGAETDRGSQNSDHVGAASKGSAEKKLSRLDILAMPRKRAGSFTTPSDNEAGPPPAGRNSYSGREPGGSNRKSSVGDARQAAAKGSGAAAKQTAGRTRSNGTKYSGTASRRRQKGSDYSSSSEEEYETSPGTSKPRRSSQPSAPSQPHRGRTAPSRPKSISVETEDDDPQNDVDPYQNWTTHSAEIAKLSHDLAKDLAILAREINDVAGDGDPPVAIAGTPISSPSSQPNTPASPISSREELVQHLPEASLNYQKVPPGCTSVLDANMNEAEPGSKQRRPWNRQEVILDNLMLNPVSQLSQAIRENTEQLAEKMKVLFHNKAEVWEEIEAKINAENEIPILKTSNKEITSILQELRRVQRQLEVINTIVEPSSLQVGALGPTSTSQTRPSARDKKPTSRPLGDRPRGGPSSSNANESTKRSSRGAAGGGGGGHHMS
ncbi:unnamed protein product [Gadus morhua 'NCC']